MNNTTKWMYLFLCLMVLCDVTITPTLGQRFNTRNKNKKKTKTKSSGGKFVPGKPTQNKPYYPPRNRRPTLGELLQRNGYGTPPKPQKPRNNQNNPGQTLAEEMNRLNYLNNMRNNNRGNVADQQANPNDRSVHYPSVGKVIPPLVRSAGEKPPFAPSWTHCVISVQVGIAWVVVKSPRYPSKFQGQVQCSWIATASEGYRVRLSFKDLDLLPPVGNGCGNQFVEVIDMNLQKSQARFCGSHTPGDYVSQGNKLRLDLQADAIHQQYRGFMAAFRADREVPGMRETSYFADGVPEVLYNPLTDSPPVNPRPASQTRRPLRRPSPSPTRKTLTLIPGQKIYGAHNQYQNQPEKKDPEEDSLSSSTTHLYIIIAVILVILGAAAAAYIFKRFFYKKFKVWWKKYKNEGVEHPGEDATEMKNVEGVYNSKKTQLPGMIPLPPTPSYPDEHLGNSFMGGFYGAEQKGPMEPHMSNMPMTPHMNGRYGFLQRSHSLDDVRNDQWMGHVNEPIYEDDAMSVHSALSVRSSNRHPDHANIRQQKIMERQNSLRRMQINSINGGQVEPQPPAYSVYNSLDPYRPSNSFNGQYYPCEYQYSSLPPTNGIYGAYPMTSPPMYTSSMSDLAMKTNAMAPARPGNTKSLYDITNSSTNLTSQMPDITSQWSNTLEKRRPSMTSNTSATSSTNPILKKTTPSLPNELAFSALRAAKSMNDLTAINTKLNECVSWTLPSQRRKSLALDYSSD